MKGIRNREVPLEHATALVHEAIESVLPAKQREAVHLFFFEDLSQSEIARRLGVSQQVIQRRLHGSPRRGALIGGALPRLRAALTSAFSTDTRSKLR